MRYSKLTPQEKYAYEEYLTAIMIQNDIVRAHEIELAEARKRAGLAEKKVNLAQKQE
jgi:hypothetical protein